MAAVPKAPQGEALLEITVSTLTGTFANLQVPHDCSVALCKQVAMAVDKWRGGTPRHLLSQLTITRNTAKLRAPRGPLRLSTLDGDMLQDAETLLLAHKFYKIDQSVLLKIMRKSVKNHSKMNLGGGGAQRGIPSWGGPQAAAESLWTSILGPLRVPCGIRKSIPKGIIV